MDWKQKAKDKANDAKWWLKDRAEDCKRFYQYHREEVLLFGPVLIAGGWKIIHNINKERLLNKQEALKEEYCYDNRLGHYWALRRKLSNDEWLEVERRKAAGENLGDILESLKVLK